MTPRAAAVAARELEIRPGDSYGVDVGHIVMPNGSLIAVYQNGDDMAGALVSVYRDEVLGPLWTATSE